MDDVTQMTQAARGREDKPGLRLRSLGTALASHRITVLHQGLDGRYDLAENVPRALFKGDVVGRTQAEVWDDAAQSALKAAMETAAGAGSASTQLEIHDADRVGAFDARVSRDVDESGEEAGLLVTFAEVTEARDREQALRSLMREVSHRSKNLLAIVQAVSMQTARHSETIGDFLTRFRGRLQALAGTQDLVTESNWTGTSFRALVDAQLMRMGQDSATKRITVTGDDPVIGPNAALHLGLALHELAANAVVYGALSDAAPSGHIGISVTLTPAKGGGGRLFVMEWHERGIGSVAADIRPARFGTVVLEKIVPRSVGGTSTYTISSGEVSYCLEIPDDQFAR